MHMIFTIIWFLIMELKSNYSMGFILGWAFVRTDAHSLNEVGNQLLPIPSFWHLAVLPPSSMDTGPPEQGACISGPGAARGPNTRTGLARCFCGRTTSSSSNSSEPVNMRREPHPPPHICCEQLTKLWSESPPVSHAHFTIVRNNNMAVLY